MTALLWLIYLLFIYGVVNAVIDLILIALYIIGKWKGRIK